MKFQEWWEKEHGGKQANSAHMHIARSFAREAWKASRDNMQEYQKHEFCRAVECENMQEKCMVGDGYCSFTAKEFHSWLRDNRYRIMKGE